MARWILARLGPLAIVGVLAGWLAAPALADWKLNSTSTTSVAYNQGMTFDGVGSFYFDGVSSTSNSAIYRTSSSLSRTGSNTAVIPATKEGYNHAGDLSFDPSQGRLLLPLECYYPNSTPSNTCGSGAFGVVDPKTLAFQYYVRLWTPQIQKAMWDEISPDGRWIWTSSGTHLLAYNAANVNQQTADNQRAGVWGGLGGTDLGSVLPTSNVTGAAFYAGRLFLALDRGTYFQVVSYGVGSASDGSPTLLSATPTVEITVTKSSSNSESEGLTATAALNGSYPLGGLLHWQMLPSIKLYSRILNYVVTAPGSGSSIVRSVAARCVVPKLANRTRKSANTLLRAAHCRLGSVTTKHASRSRRGRVIAQKPEPGAVLPLNARVTLVLGRRR
ncbi:MAG TPA: PASTA domain-containing protein [Solirubrobacteraceae bacterium]|nr:PASTA domain-containing protein [Solirubrobacteraceae bacterium]